MEKYYRIGDNMKIKRIILLTAVLMIAITSLSMVSAGWFDFGGDNNDDKPKNTTVDIIESSITYNCVAGNGLSVDSNGDNFKVEQDNSGNEGKTLEYEGYVKVNVSSLDQNELKENLSTNDYPNRYWDVSYDCNKLTTKGLSGGANHTLENGVLTLKFNGTEKLNSYDGVQPGSSGTEKLSGGDICFYNKEINKEGTAFILFFKWFICGLKKY